MTITITAGENAAPNPAILSVGGKNARPLPMLLPHTDLESPDSDGGQGGVQLTGKGIAYALRHDRDAIERRIDRHLALVTALLALIDQADGDPDLEPYLAGIDGGPSDDREGGDVQDEPHDPETDEPTLGFTEHQMATGRLDYDDWRILDECEAEDEGDELDHYGESDGLENGELDYAESDGGGHITGGGYHV